MEEIMEFIESNYILILAIILVLLFMILGYYVDKKKLLKGKIGKNKEDNKIEEKIVEKDSVIENNEPMFNDIKETDFTNEEPVLVKEPEGNNTENTIQEVQDIKEEPELDVSFQEIEKPRKKNRKFKEEKSIEPEISIDSSVQNNTDSQVDIEPNLKFENIELEQPLQEIQIKEDIPNNDEIDKQEDLLKTQDLEQILEKNAIVKDDLYPTMDLTTEFGPFNTSIKNMSQNQDLDQIKDRDNYNEINSSEEMSELEAKEKALLEKYNVNTLVGDHIEDTVSQKEDLNIEIDETPTIDFSNVSNKAIPISEHDKLYSKAKIRNLEEKEILDNVNSAIQQELKAKLEEKPSIENSTIIDQTEPIETKEDKVNEDLESIMDLDKGFDKIYNPNNSSSNFTYEESSPSEVLSTNEDITEPVLGDSNEVIVPPDLYKNIKNTDLIDDDISIEPAETSTKEDINSEKTLIEQLKDLELPSMDSLDKINQKLNDNLSDDIWKF